jgi:hypothetical protein
MKILDKTIGDNFLVKDMNMGHAVELVFHTKHVRRNRGRMPLPQTRRKTRESGILPRFYEVAPIQMLARGLSGSTSLICEFSNERTDQL